MPTHRGDRPPSSHSTDRAHTVAAAAWAAALVGGALLAVVIAGCGASARSTTVRSAGQAAAVLRELSRCIRAHGMPNFPDPETGNDGVPRLPDSAPRVPATTEQACRSIAARIPARYTSTQPVSAADFQKLIRFARCIRAHGIAAWPDPNALGEFPINRRIESGGKRLFVGPVRACARLNPDPSGGIHLVRGY